MLAELEHARQRADSLNQLSASVKAITEKAKLAGLMIDRKAIEVTTRNVTTADRPDDILQAFWHSCTIGCPDIEITDEDRECLLCILGALRALEDQMIGREMQRVIEQDRIARQVMNKAAPAQIEHRRALSDRERLFDSGLFNDKGRPHG